MTPASAAVDALTGPALTSSAVADRRISILGATGSVGGATLDLVASVRARSGPEACPITALTAGRNVERLAALARTYRPDVAVIAEPELYGPLKEALAGADVAVAAGPDAVAEAAGAPADWVMAAIVGAAGLKATMAAVTAGAHVALANKESLVCAGPLLTREAARCGGRLLPVDSEHNAIFQVLDMDQLDAVERLILTASGGPFRTAPLEAMAAATPDQAVAHPVWSMGAKISVDSATLMNKGLELIEARWLFGVESARLDVVVHPQSIVHSLVEYRDGSVLAQLGSPDMRIPIASALAWPGRMETPAARLDLARIGQLTFEPPDEARFPALTLARRALDAEGAAPAALNAANEVAVGRFLDGRLGFLDIAGVVDEVLEAFGASSSAAGALADLDAVFAADQDARRRAGIAADRLAAKR